MQFSMLRPHKNTFGGKVGKIQEICSLDINQVRQDDNFHLKKMTSRKCPADCEIGLRACIDCYPKTTKNTYFHEQCHIICTGFEYAEPNFVVFLDTFHSQGYAGSRKRKSALVTFHESDSWISEVLKPGKRISMSSIHPFHQLELPTFI